MRNLRSLPLVEVLLLARFSVRASRSAVESHHLFIFAAAAGSAHHHRRRGSLRAGFEDAHVGRCAG